VPVPLAVAGVGRVSDAPAFAFAVSSRQNRRRLSAATKDPLFTARLRLHSSGGAIRFWPSSRGAQRRRISLRFHVLAQPSNPIPGVHASINLGRIRLGENAAELQIPLLQYRHVVRHMPRNNISQRIHRNQIPARHASPFPRFHWHIAEKCEGRPANFSKL
jgi:hypothetical protein